MPLNQRPPVQFTASADGRYGMVAVIVIDAKRPPGVAVPLSAYTLTVNGWVKVAPGVVEHGVGPVHPPVSHAQLDINTVMLDSSCVPGPTCTRSPNSLVEVAWKPMLLTLPGGEPIES